MHHAREAHLRRLVALKLYLASVPSKLVEGISHYLQLFCMTGCGDMTLRVSSEQHGGSLRQQCSNAGHVAQELQQRDYADGPGQ